MSQLVFFDCSKTSYLSSQ